MGQMYFPGEGRNTSSSRPTYTNYSSGNSSNNDDDDWKWGCGIVIAIIIAFCMFKSCDDDSSSSSSAYEEEIIEDSVVCDDYSYSEPEPARVEPVTTTQPTAKTVDFSSLRETIKKWNSLRIATITDTGEGAAVYESNGFSCHNAPDGLYEKLHSINNSKYHIDDINIVDNNSYVVIYGDYGYSVKGAPQAFIDKLHEYNSAKETIYSASFNNYNEWVIITNKHYSWSNSEIRDFCSSAQDNYGNIKYMFISDYGKVACCERGIYYANLPSNVEQAIDNFKYTPSSIKFTDSGKYAIANERGASSFNF